MEFEKPCEKGFTIYSKSGCSNCTKAKQLIKDKHLLFNVVDCDNYLIEEKELFLNFIKDQANQTITTFPIIFCESKFVGGYQETIKFIDKLFVCFC
jgi:glutaredoxin